MRKAALAALVVLGAAPAVSGQVLPGEEQRAPAFPSALSIWALAGFGGQRATRTYIDVTDADCDTVPCVSKHGLSGSIGIGTRFQTPLSPRMGLRFGVSYSAPRQKARRTEPTHQTSLGDRLGMLRGEILLVHRLKPQVPVFFGFGVALASISPGPLFGQDGVTEAGAVVVVGLDRRINPRVGTRIEWTGYFMRPSTRVVSPEFRATWLAFDSQLSFGANFYLNP